MIQFLATSNLTLHDELRAFVKDYKDQFPKVDIKSYEDWRKNIPSLRPTTKEVWESARTYVMIRWLSCRVAVHFAQMPDPNLEEQPEIICSDCGDTGYVVIDSEGHGTYAECQCLLSKGTKTLIEQYLSESGIPKKFRLGWSSFKTHKDNLEAFSGIRDYLANFSDAQRSGQGIGLIGQVGTGKTHLVSIALQNIIRSGKGKINGKIVNMSAAMFDLMPDSEDYRKFLTTLKQASVLVLDDLGSESPLTDWRLSMIFQLVDYRVSEQKITWFTSNNSLDDLVGYYSKVNDIMAGRIGDRLREGCVIYQIAGSKEQKSEIESTTPH